jgi:hypothetical protein
VLNLVQVANPEEIKAQARHATAMFLSTYAA